MGGIVPNAIDIDSVDKYLATNTRRKKKIQFRGQKFSANNWKAVLLAVLTPELYRQLVEILTHYLRTAANYSISGGPRAVEAMGIVRGMIGSAPQPLPQLIVRIIRDMRTLRPSIKKVRRQMFIDERNPVKALRYMQFIPSVGIYRDTIQAMPSTYSTKMLRYATNPALRRSAAARALIKARNLTDDPKYVPDLMGTDPLTQEQYFASYILDPAVRRSMMWTKGPNPNASTDPKVLARLEQGRRTAQANLERALAQVGSMPGMYGAFKDASAAEAKQMAKLRTERASAAVQAAQTAAAQAAQAAAAAAQAAQAAAAAQRPVPPTPAMSVPPTPAMSVPPTPDVTRGSFLKNPYDSVTTTG